MNPEWLMIAAMVCGGAMFAIGGTGPKWVRRYLLPAALAGIALWGGFIWWACLGYAVTQCVTFCLPYGDRTPYWLKFIVFMSFAAPSLFFGFTWWQPVCGLVCFGTFCLSNWKVTANIFVWKICEFIIGASIGITVASLIAQHAR